MPSHKPVIAVFDIGKTNKKFFLFDENYSVVEKHQTELEQAEDEDGDPCENLKQLEAWIRDQLAAAKQRYPVQALNFSAYGASLVHIDEKGNPVTPLYNYLKPYSKNLLNQFYESVGGKKEFSLQTASPPMGMLNSGLQLYWLKHQKSELFRKIETSLHFPNYLSHIFTGEKTSELTSIGCHTALWDFDRSNYHQWVKNEKVKALFPTPQSVSKTVKMENGMKIGTGIHDSSAALAPYLIGLDEPFMLISTGTWSITFNPFNDEPLTFKELEKDCLCYLDIFGNQVKASRLFLGSEYVHQKRKICKYFSVRDEELEIELDHSLMNKLVRNKNPECKLQLEQAFNSGPYPLDKPGNWQVSHFSSPKEAYHQLMLDLVGIQAESIRLVQGSEEVDKLIITGGFSQNECFVSLLASFFPEKKIYTSLLPDASALGAALVIDKKTTAASQVRTKGISDWGNNLKMLLGLNRVNPIEGLNTEQYSWIN